MLKVARTAVVQATSVFIFVLLALTWIWFVPGITCPDRTSWSSTAPAGNQSFSLLSIALSGYCANFTGDVNGQFYLNYTSLSNLHFHTYSGANHSHPGMFHLAVSSAADNFRVRQVIRQTWGKLLRTGSSCSPDVSMMFYVGKTSDPVTALTLQWELHQYPDDMVLIDFCEAYENLPLKTFNMMRFVQANYPNTKYVVKMDDDVLPNIPLLVSCFDAKVATTEHGIYGIVSYKGKPANDGKYAISHSRFANNTFPPFAHGPAYLVKRSDLAALLDAAAQTPVLNLEDVWFTGVVAGRAGVKQKNGNNFLQLDAQLKQFTGNVRTAVDRAFFFHHISSTDLQKIWESYAPNCDTTNEIAVCKYVL